MEGGTEGEMDGWTDRQMDGWTKGWTDGWREGWRERRREGRRKCNFAQEENEAGKVSFAGRPDWSPVLRRTGK